MKIQKYALFLLLPLLSAGLTTQVNAYDKPCWEPQSSPAPDGTLCWFDHTSMGLGWQIGVVANVTANNSRQRVCMNVNQTTGAPLMHNKFYWLLMEKPKSEAQSLPFGQPVHQFIGGVEYCPGTRERNTSRTPIIPQDKRQSRPDDDLVCRKLNPDSLVVGIDVKDKGCMDILDVKYSFSAKAPQQPQQPAANWYEHNNPGWAYYFVTHADGRVERVETHHRCKSHCRRNAKQEAEKKHHRYVSYDGDNYHTGTHVNWQNKDRGKNTVYENLNEMN